MAAPSPGIVLAALVLLGGCGGGGDALPAAEADADRSPGSASASPAPSPAAEAHFWIGGEPVTEPHTARVTREVDGEGRSVRHRVTVEIPGRGWDVRLSLPTAPFTLESRDGDGTVTGERLVEPDREPWHWCMSAGCTDVERPVIDRLVIGGVVYGTEGVPPQGASDPCANGGWQPGDPPRDENRQGAVSGVTERLTPGAEGTLYLFGLDDECRANAPYPGVEVEFVLPVE